MKTLSFVQATFSVYEKFRQLSDLVTECLETPLPFVLHDAGGRRLEVKKTWEKNLASLIYIDKSNICRWPTTMKPYPS